MVVVQSSLYDGFSRRVVVPLVRRSTLARTAGFLDTPLNPVFTVKGIKVVLHPLEMVSVALKNLGEKVATLVEEGDAIFCRAVCDANAGLAVGKIESDPTAARAWS